MVDVKSEMWTSCEKKALIIKKKKHKSEEMRVVRILGIVYLLIGSINIGMVINFVKVLSRI